MAQRIVRMQTAFTAGELDPALKGRRDTALYYLGCERLRNWLITPQGGVVRRPGLRSFVPTLATKIAGAVGTPIGNMTSGGGLAVAYDGNTAHPNNACARLLTTLSANIGKDWGSGSTRTITGFRMWPSTDAGFLGGGNAGATFHVKLQGSTDNFVSSVVDLADVDFVEPWFSIPEERSLFGSAITTTTAYRYHRILMTFGSAVDMFVSEVEFFEGQHVPAGDAVLLAAFVFALNQEYLIAFSDGEVRIWDAVSGNAEKVLNTPWGAADLDLLRWTQLRDTMIVVHPNHQPKAIVRLPDDWAIEDYTLLDENGDYFGPFAAFHSPGTTFSRSSGVLSATKPYFVSGHVGTYLRITPEQKRIKITAVNSAVSANFDTIDGALTGTNIVTEQAFSSVRGWPRSVGFHHQRLVFGGSRDAPNRIWLSRIGEFRDFTLGEGEDDDGISYDLGTGQVYEVMHVSSGRGGLEVFLRGEEGILPSSQDAPITPRTVSFQRQTGHGSGNAKPTNIDGATVFLQRREGTVREFLWSESERGYIAPSLSIRAPHLIRSPVAIESMSDALGRQMDLIFVVNGDGEVAIFTSLRSQQITAWSSMLTNGTVRSIAVVGDRVFMAVERQALSDLFRIEVLDPAARLDSSVTRSNPTPLATWSDLEIFASQEVQVIADDLYLGTRTVSNGGVLTLDVAASEIEVGYDFTPEILPMPLEQPDTVMMGRPKQIYRVVLRVQDAAGLVLEAIGKDGRLLSRSRLPTLLFEGATDAPVPGVSGIVERRLLGWDKDANCRVTQEGPFPAQVLSMMLEVAVGA